MKVLAWAPEWGNRWLPYFREELKRYDTEWSHTADLERIRQSTKGKDCIICFWAEGLINLWSAEFPEIPLIAFLRRYEAFRPSILQGMAFDHVDALIFVNDRLRQLFSTYDIKQPKKTYYIPNAVDVSEFPVKYGKGKKIAFVCKMTYIKNFPLALQILSLLPEEYTLHYLGEADAVRLLEFAFYGMNLGVMQRVKIYRKLPPQEVNNWLADKDYILSTSINEGNPNNVLEGMACGLKPVVHNWPGAKEQFPQDCVFNTAEEAVRIIQGDYNSQFYRDYAVKHYSLENIKKIHQVIEDVCG